MRWVDCFAAIGSDERSTMAVVNDRLIPLRCLPATFNSTQINLFLLNRFPFVQWVALSPALLLILLYPSPRCLFPFWIVLSLILLLIPFGPFRCASSFVPCHSMTFQLKSNQRNNIRTLGRHGDRTEEMRCCGD